MTNTSGEDPRPDPGPDTGHYQPPPYPGYQQPAAQPYGQPGYYAPAYSPPLHPNATISMVLGIVGLATIPILCCLGLFVSPVAWVLGARAMRAIDAAPQLYSGRGQAKAGLVMGIVGTVLLILSIIAIVLFFGFIVTAEYEDPVTYENT